MKLYETTRLSTVYSSQFLSIPQVLASMKNQQTLPPHASTGGEAKDGSAPGPNDFFKLPRSAR